MQTNGIFNFFRGLLLPLERLTNAIGIIDSNHAQVHAKRAFTISGLIDVAAGAVAGIQIDVPAGAYIHMQLPFFSADGGPISVSLLEDYSFTEVAKAELLPINSHRASPIDSEISVFAYHAITAEAGAAPVTLATINIPATTQGSQRVGAESGVNDERILRPETSYLLGISNASASSVKVGYYLFWYEETGI